MNKLFFSLIGSILLILSLQSFAQTNIEAKALYLSSFPKHIQWNTFVNQKAIVIGILGDSTLVTELSRITSNKKIEGKKILVKPISTLDVADCQIVYLSEYTLEKFNEVFESIKHLPILLITNNKHSCYSKSDIVLVIDRINKKEKSILLNKKRILEKGLKISNNLLELSELSL